MVSGYHPIFFSDLICLDIDPVSRLLYFIVLKRQSSGIGDELLGSLVIYHIENSQSVILFEDALTNPTSLALNTKYG